MALINCPECKRKISDECDFCPKCGYGLKKKLNDDTNNKLSLMIFQITAFISLLCSIVLTLADVDFYRFYNSKIDLYYMYTSTRNFRYALIEGGYLFIWIIMLISMILSIVSIIIYRIKKIKIKHKILLFIPNIIYTLTALITFLIAVVDGLKQSNSSSTIGYEFAFGSIVTIIFAITSLILLIIDVVKNKNRY